MIEKQEEEQIQLVGTSLILQTVQWSMFIQSQVKHLTSVRKSLLQVVAAAEAAAAVETEMTETTGMFSNDDNTRSKQI